MQDGILYDGKDLQLADSTNANLSGEENLLLVVFWTSVLEPFHDRARRNPWLFYPLLVVLSVFYRSEISHNY